MIQLDELHCARKKDQVRACLNEMANLISEEKKERNLSRVREVIKGNAFHEAIYNAALPSASKKSLEKQQALLEKVLTHLP